MAEVQAADPRARRAALIMLAIAFVAGTLLLWALNTSQSAVASWLREDPARMVRRARWLLAGLAVVTSGPAIAAGAYLLRLGSRVIAAERFPPPGLRVVQDTIVLTGDAARSRGRIFQGLGVLLMVTGASLALLLARLAPR